MTDLSSTPAAESPAPQPSADLPRQVQQLRTMLMVTLVLVVLISLCLNVYLWRQLVYLRRDLAAFKPQANQLISNYQRNEPAVREFLRKLTEYSRTHLDFAPILQKYPFVTNTPIPGVPMPPAANAAPPAAGPAPAPATPAK